MANWSAGEEITAAKLNDRRGFDDTGASVYTNIGSPQSINDGDTDILEFSVETFDKGSNFNTATYKYTAPADGIYLIVAQIGFVSIPTDGDVIAIRIYKNDGDTGRIASASNAGDANDYAFASISVILDLSSGDTISAYGEMHCSDASKSILARMDIIRIA